jgi:hypothetical protein
MVLYMNIVSTKHKKKFTHALSAHARIHTNKYYHSARLKKFDHPQQKV